MAKLTEQQHTTLKLIARSLADENGWVTCASEVYRQLIVPMPDVLVEKHPERFAARLTPEAKIILKWM